MRFWWFSDTQQQFVTGTVRGGAGAGKNSQFLRVWRAFKFCGSGRKISTRAGLYCLRGEWAASHGKVDIESCQQFGLKKA